MTQQQQQIIEEYLFDVFVKLEGNGEKSVNWWNNVFLLEALTTMGQRNYSIATFCEPSKFFKDDDDNGTEYNEEDTASESDQDDTDDDSTYISSSEEAVYTYLENYSEWELNDIANMNNAVGKKRILLQSQYVYVYTLENSDYFMNKFIHGDEKMLK